MSMFFNEMTAWLLFTAIIFTGVGYWMRSRNDFEDVISATIDSLINDGYIKTEGYGDNMEIVKWEDWCKNDTD